MTAVRHASRPPSIPAVTLWRPWTAFITDLPETIAKRVENRGWATKHRADLYLHAGVRFERHAFGVLEAVGPPGGWLGDGYEAISDWSDSLPRTKTSYPTGIVAVVNVVDVCSASFADPRVLACDCGPWAFPGQHHWRFDNVRRLPKPVPCKGSQMLWNPPREVVDAVTAQLAQVAS